MFAWSWHQLKMKVISLMVLGLVLSNKFKIQKLYAKLTRKGINDVMQNFANMFISCSMYKIKHNPHSKCQWLLTNILIINKQVLRTANSEDIRTRDGVLLIIMGPRRLIISPSARKYADKSSFYCSENNNDVVQICCNVWWCLLLIRKIEHLT